MKVVIKIKIEVNKVKIIVMVPMNNTDEVRHAACSNGAGIIGNYSYCTTCSKVVGSFIPNDIAKPYIGNNNELEMVEEDKLEFVCDIKLAKKVIDEIRKVHLYEEPAIDIVPLINEYDLTK